MLKLLGIISFIAFVLLLYALYIELKRLYCMAFMSIFSAHRTDQRILTALLIQTNKVQLLTSMIFIATLSIPDSVFWLTLLYHRQLRCLKIYKLNNLFISVQHINNSINTNICPLTVSQIKNLLTE